MSERVPPIRSELLAGKIEKLLNFELPDLFDQFAEEPRFIRVLWFLEYVSKPQNYAGGLTKFAHDFIHACADQIGTAAMAKTGGARERYSAEDAIVIFKEMPAPHRKQVFGDDYWIFENAFLERDELATGRVTIERIVEIWNVESTEEPRVEDVRESWNGTGAELLGLFTAKLTPVAARELCAQDARESLAGYFKRLCELPHVGLRPNENGHGAPQYFNQVGPALLNFIEKRSADLRSKLAETEVTQLITRWMTKARTMRRPIMISGNSRFGKTEAVKLLCEMEPGNFRMVNTPASNAIGDLFREVARSLGIEVAAQNSVRDLRERIEYVLRFSNLALCFDEFQLALPASFSRNTAPARLNWVRRAVMDQGLAAVFICTPQSYLPAKNRFVRTTGFAMEQFDERILKTIHLPDELSEADLFAVARIHFAGLGDDYLQVVVGAALATERNYISDIEKIATLAKDNAREQGRDLPLLDDIEAAIADVLPTRPTPATAPLTTRKRPPIAARIPMPPQGARKAPASPLQTARISLATLPESRRGMPPLAVKT